MHLNPYFFLNTNTMLQINDTVISLDILNEEFICDLSACYGECCIDGDAGAPLEIEEIGLLEEVLPIIWNKLSPAAQLEIKEKGVAYVDLDGEMVTSIVYGKDCVFTYYDADGTCKCAIEKAFFEGKTTFRKPISCHLYPIRVKKYKSFSAVNYHRWSICSAACELGKAKKVKLYQFLKEPLIRKFGDDWYSQLCIAADELGKNSK